MRRTMLTLAVLCMVGALAVPAGAQERHGTVAGTVRDGAGQALPGATVVLAGTNMMGTRTAISGEDGDFRFTLVPPGRYSVEVQLPGFQGSRAEEVPVSLGRTAQLDVVLQLGAFTDTVEVVADQILIDTTSSTVGSNITGDFVGTLANDRQYQMVMSLLPGAIEANNPFIHGASGADNMYLVDGADSSDPMTRTWSAAMNFDNLQEVQVVTGGAKAEYGKGTGAVVNLITKSGSNELHGVARFTYSDEDLNSERKGDSTYFDDATRYISEKRPSFNMGGPILRDQLWFFTSYEERSKTKPITTYASPADALAGSWTHTNTAYEGHYITGKLTWQLSPSHNVVASYMEDPIEIPNLYAYLGYNNRAPEADNLREQGGWNGILNYTGILDEDSFVGFKANVKRNELNNTPVGSGPTYYAATANGGVYWGNATSHYATDRDHEIFSIDYTRFVDTAGGSHELKGGLEYALIELGYYSESYPGNDYTRFRADATTPWYRYTYEQRPGWRDTETTTYSLFVQDTWRMNEKLTLNLGVRLEQLTEETPQGYKGLDWGLGDRIQPRLGFAYALGAAGESSLHGSVGRFHDTIGNYVTRSFVQAPNLIYSRWNWNEDTSGWDFFRTYEIGAAFVSQDELDSPYMDELTLGYQGKLSATMAWGVDAVYREWQKGIEDDDGRDFADNPANDGNYHFTNLDKIREYQGIEFTLKKMLGQDKLQFLASYTLSETESLWGDEDYASVYADNPFNYYQWWGNPSYDYRHVVKFNGSYYLPYDFVVGSNLTFWSGAPYTVYADVQTSDDGVWGGESFSDYYLEPRGSRRLPDTWRMDLRLEKSFTFAGRYIVALYADVFNVFDQQKVVDRDGYYGVVYLDEPGQTPTAQDVSGNFEEPTEWQAPRSYFFGAKFEF